MLATTELQDYLDELWQRVYLLRPGRGPVAEMIQAYEEVIRRWTGCD